MPRIVRLVVKGEPAVYHVISRSDLDGFVLAQIPHLEAHIHANALFL